MANSIDRSALGSESTFAPEQWKGRCMARGNSNSERSAIERATQQGRSSGAKVTNEWIDAQAELFEQFDHIATEWLGRRREALDATRRSIEQLKTCGEMGDFLRVQQEWVEGSMRRLTEDLTEFAKVAFAVPQVAASRFGQAAATMGRGMNRVQEDLLSAHAKEAAE
jgi:hypothetical protein